MTKAELFFSFPAPCLAIIFFSLSGHSFHLKWALLGPSQSHVDSSRPAAVLSFGKETNGPISGHGSTDGINLIPSEVRTRSRAESARLPAGRVLQAHVKSLGNQFKSYEDCQKYGPFLPLTMDHSSQGLNDQFGFLENNCISIYNPQK